MTLGLCGWVVGPLEEDRKVMGYDNNLAERVRKVLTGHPGMEERRMFGGLAFMLRGKMCCGVVGNDVVIRVGPDEYEAALSESNTREMDFTGRPLKGFVYVNAEGVASDKNLRDWVTRAVRFAASLPAKKPAKGPTRMRRKQ